MSEGAQLWVLLMIVRADYFGRGCAERVHLFAQLCPRCSPDPKAAEERLQELKDSRLVVFYRAEEQDCYYFPKWFSIQRFTSICHPAPTRYPNPPNPPKAYVNGSIRLCRAMLKRGYRDPDEHVNMTEMLGAGWLDEVDARER